MVQVRPGVRADEIANRVHRHLWNRPPIMGGCQGLSCIVLFLALLFLKQDSKIVRRSWVVAGVSPREIRMGL
ncbi:unnamed protein product [Victoria cruziana]